MIVALGKLALNIDLRAAMLAEPLLFDDAFRAYQAPDGSALELRGALVLLGLGAAELRVQTVQRAPSVGYEMGALGAILYASIAAAGGDPRQAVRAVRAALDALGTPATKAPAAPVKVERPHMTDPYPGLTRDGETWPDFSMRRKNTAEDLSVFEEWKAAAMAWDAKRIDAWVAEVGGSLGFRWEPPGEG